MTLSPTIFNAVVGVLIRHWVMMMVLTEAGLEGVREKIQKLVAFFYADDGPVVFPRPERLQMEFNVLTDLFDQVGIHTNMRNTVRMAFQP